MRLINPPYGFDFNVGDILEVAYSGRAYKLRLNPGVYSFTLKGGDGGRALIDSNPGSWGGSGGLTSFNLFKKSGSDIYISVGGIGLDGVKLQNIPGGWNGGGMGIHDSNRDDDTGSSGGGCTDVSLDWAGDLSEPDNSEHISSRICVAGGGGGTTSSYITCQTGNFHGNNTEGLNSSWKGQDGYLQTSVGAGGAGAGYFGGLSCSTTGRAARGGSGFISEDTRDLIFSNKSIVSGSQDITHSNGYCIIQCLSLAKLKFLVSVKK